MPITTGSKADLAHVKKFRLPMYQLLKMLRAVTSGRVFGAIHDVPEDAKVVRVWADEENAGFWVLLSSSFFAAVPEGQEIPDGGFLGEFSSHPGGTVEVEGELETSDGPLKVNGRIQRRIVKLLEGARPK